MILVLETAARARQMEEVMVDRAVIYFVCAIIAFWGLVSIDSALEGAGVVARYFVRPEVPEFTAYRAVTMLLFGQACVIIGLAVPYWWAQADKVASS